MSRSRADLLDRAEGSLWGLAIGDALGMPTQLLPRRTILATFGEITRFEAPGPDHPIAAGLLAGTVTDDTQQAVILGRALGPGAHIDQRELARALLAWEQEMKARGSLDLLGPSTTAALQALQSGTAAGETGRTGTTNGAAMRICPVGLAVAADDLGQLVDRVVETSMLTHNTSTALAAAAAVAAAVSAGVDGATLPDAIALAVRAADLAAMRGHWVAGGSVARRIECAVDRAVRLPTAELLDFVEDVVGTSLASQESIPAAFSILAALPGDPWRVVCAAASVGGDCDTIAAIAGAIAGAIHGTDGFPPWAIDTVRAVNRLDLDRLARRLVDLRCP